MNLLPTSRRRLTVLGLAAVIAVACGFILRTAVERELISPKAVLGFWAVMSPRSVDRAYYRLRADGEALLLDAKNLLSESSPEDGRKVMARLREQQAELLVKYDTFVATHPEHVDGLVAHADLLAQSGDRAKSLDQLETAARLAGNRVELWRELVDRSIHFGEVQRAFPACESALKLAPDDLGLLRTFANSIFVYRRDAMEHYHMDEAEAFDRALKLLKRAVDLYPQNMDIALDFAGSFYSIKPTRHVEAIAAWDHVRKISTSEFDRQNATLHIARFLIRVGERQKAGVLLAEVTLPEHSIHKGRVSRLISGTPEILADSLVTPARFTGE